MKAINIKECGIITEKRYPNLVAYKAAEKHGILQYKIHAAMQSRRVLQNYKYIYIYININEIILTPESSAEGLQLAF